MSTTATATTPLQQSPFRPERQEAELEALQQRGLAKLLNKHFTKTTQWLVAEKAAVDAAFRDLEDKRAKALTYSEK
ncbi:hypothetical protein ACA910_013599 [Epithemia clementina (nom. ined.)]